MKNSIVNASIVHNLKQGSPEWHAFRAEHDGASEIAAVMGLSKHTTRAQILHQKTTGMKPEVSQFTQGIFDKGHESEALTMPIIEGLLGESLYPVTMSVGRQSASCDGLTADGEIGWENKQWNTEYAAMVENGVMPEEHMPQVQQCLKITGAKKWIFSISDGTSERCVKMLVYPDQKWFDRIDAAWEQFNKDRAEYVPPVVAAPVVAKTVSALPVVFDMRVEGKLVSCNISAYKPAALAYIAAINSDLVTDQDFADAEKDAKYCIESAKKLRLSIEQALGQMGNINEAISMVREIAATFDAKALMLEKLVKSEKESRKLAIVTAGRESFAAHFVALNARLGKPYMPPIAAEFAAVTKGLRTMVSMKNAVNTELARAKIEANAVADKIQANMGTLAELTNDYKFLFGDTATIVLKANDDLTALVKTRIAEHQANEAAKEEATRQRIRSEEQAKAEREARAKLEAEQAAERADQQRMSAIQAHGEKVAKEFAAPVFVAKPATQTATREKINAALNQVDQRHYLTILQFLENLSVN